MEIPLDIFLVKKHIFASARTFLWTTFNDYTQMITAEK